MADKPPRRPRAETPKGFRDYFGAEVTERKAMLDRIAAVYHRYGFDPLETSPWKPSRPSASSSPTSTAPTKASSPGRTRTPTGSPCATT